MTTLPINRCPRGTIEYVSADLTDTSGATLTNVAMAIHNGDPTTWLPCTWAGGVAKTTSPVAFTTTDYPGNQYTVSMRAVDSAETPIVRVGTIVIV